MAQVSRRPMTKAMKEEMNRLFRKALASLKTEEEISLLLDDLLTPTEKIMLAKRLAIAVLLSQNYDQRTIHRILCVSLPTVNDVAYFFKHHGAGYRNVIEKLNRDALWKDILGNLGEAIAELASPPRVSVLPRPPKEIRPVEHIL